MIKPAEFVKEKKQCSQKCSCHWQVLDTSHFVETQINFTMTALVHCLITSWKIHMPFPIKKKLSCLIKVIFSPNLPGVWIIKLYLRLSSLERIAFLPRWSIFLHDRSFNLKVLTHKKRFWYIRKRGKTPHMDAAAQTEAAGAEQVLLSTQLCGWELLPQMGIIWV